MYPLFLQGIIILAMSAALIYVGATIMGLSFLVIAAICLVAAQHELK